MAVARDCGFFLPSILPVRGPPCPVSRSPQPVHWRMHSYSGATATSQNTSSMSGPMCARMHPFGTQEKQFKSYLVHVRSHVHACRQQHVVVVVARRHERVRRRGAVRLAPRRRRGRSDRC
eukprot:180824-Chlamydomonas_euryale.AAC.1